MIIYTLYRFNLQDNIVLRNDAEYKLDRQIYS